jgi:hypothetical protein
MPEIKHEMMKHRFFPSNEFKIPERWDIYDLDENAKRGKTANAKITAAVRMALADMESMSKTQDIGPKMVTKLFKKYVDPVFKKYEDLGTYDTEPRAMVAEVFERYAVRLGAGSAAREEIYETLRWL